MTLSKRRLTPQAIETLKLLKAGYSIAEIAKERCVGVQVAKNHITRLCYKFGIKPANSIKLVIYLNCELFRIGLWELGYL